MLSFLTAALETAPCFSFLQTDLTVRDFNLSRFLSQHMRTPRQHLRIFLALWGAGLVAISASSDMPRVPPPPTKNPPHLRLCSRVSS